MTNKTVWLLAIAVPLLLAGCSREEKPKKIDLKNRSDVKAYHKDISGSIRFAVGGMITPREGLSYYKDFLDYIGEKIGRPVVFVDREDYGEINSMLEEGKLDIAFVCSGPYVDGHNRFGLELLVAPSSYGGTFYNSFIIVSRDGPVETFEGLRGRKFAFTDPLSNTGKLVPTYMLAKINETPETFFQDYVYAKSHDNAIKAVARGLVDGAAVDSLVWNYLDQTNNEYTSRTRVIEKSPDYGIPPVAVTKTMSPGLRKELRQVFLAADKDEKGRRILERMKIDRFVVVDDQIYDSVREMKSWLKEHDSK